MHFTKMEGLGNDYVMVDARPGPPADPGGLARAISDRHRGVGADGLILLLAADPPDAADLRMRMFNADGSEAEMCGNGIRCLAKLAHDRGLCRAEPMRVQTGAGVLSLWCRPGSGDGIEQVTVDMGPPILEPAGIPVAIPGDRAVDVPLDDLVGGGAIASALGPDEPEVRVTCVSMGNPHAVLFCRRAASVPLEAIGPVLERLPAFPGRTNVHVVEVLSPVEVAMRTWERGSGATQACGTGACAACVAGVLTGRTRRSIVAHLPGGDLDLRWCEQTGHVFMTGPAREVFTGTWEAKERSD